MIHQTALLLAIPMVVTSDSPDWTRFRGPGGTGIVADADFPHSFTLEDAAWRVELPGLGHSSPVTWGNDVFVTCETESGKRALICLSLTDGKQKWRYDDEFESHRQHELNSFAAATPAIDDEAIYMVWSDGDSLVGLALEHTGEVIWQRKLGPYRAQHGSGASPVVHDGVLLIVADHEIEDELSYLLGLEAGTGKEVWRRERKSERASYATPFVRMTKAGKSRAFFASTAHGITCLDPASGELVWEVDSIFQQRCVGSPVIAGDILFCSAGSGGGGKESVALKLPRDGSKPASESAWKVERSLPYVPTAIAHEDRLYLLNDGGIVSCVRSDDGEVVWRERVDGRFFGSPICIGDRLFAMSMDGELVVLRAADEYELLGRVDLGEPSQATPAVAGGMLLLRTEHHLMAIAENE